MRVIQLTDLHLPSTPELLFQGVDTYSHLDLVLEHVRKESPDWVILTGDLSGSEEDASAYQHLRQKMNESGLRWVAFPGNHDRGSLLKEVLGDHCLKGFAPLPFGRQGNRLAGKSEQNSVSRRHWVFDNSDLECPAGMLEQVQAELLVGTDPIFLWCHYPPIAVGIPHFDDIHVSPWRTDQQRVLESGTREVVVFFGHLHLEFEAHQGRCHYYGCPSATYPVVLEGQTPAYNGERLYYRIAEFSPNGWTTEVRSIDNSG